MKFDKKELAAVDRIKHAFDELHAAVCDAAGHDLSTITLSIAILAAASLVSDASKETKPNHNMNNTVANKGT